jgi:lipopolysaccharide transport system ATP-binding protein
VDLLLMEHSLAQHDALVRARALAGIGRLRSGGSTVLIVSHELDLLQSVCDEIWWLDTGTLERAAIRARCWTPIARASRKKCGPGAPRSRARCGRPCAEATAAPRLCRSKRWAPKIHRRLAERRERAVRVTVRYHDAVEEPVIGILIRTRIGLEVYGTNTELEKVSTGSCAAGDRMRIEFAFRCDLCPGEYTITAASHDADGTAHDWVDDAVAFSVADSRYTAGVANLRAKDREAVNQRCGMAF